MEGAASLIDVLQKGFGIIKDSWLIQFLTIVVLSMFAWKYKDSNSDMFFYLVVALIVVIILTGHTLWNIYKNNKREKLASKRLQEKEDLDTLDMIVDRLKISDSRNTYQDALSSSERIVEIINNDNEPTEIKGRYNKLSSLEIELASTGYNTISVILDKYVYEFILEELDKLDKMEDKHQSWLYRVFTQEQIDEMKKH